MLMLASFSDNSTQDWYIFFGGAAFTLFMFGVIYHYLG